MIGKVRLGLFLPVAIWTLVQLPVRCDAQTAAKNHEQILTINQHLSEIEKEISALQASTSTAENQIDQRLKVVEKSSAANSSVPDEQRAYLKNVDALRARFEGIQTKLEQTAEHVSDTEMSVANNYFQIFALVVALSGVAVGLLGYFASVAIKRTVSDAVLEKSRAEIEKKIKESIERAESEMNARALYETDLARAETFFQQGSPGMSIMSQYFNGF